MVKITYERLFTYLKEIGFEDSSPSEFERVFEHSGHGILFAFSMLDDGSVDRPVRAVDITSVEFRLQQEGLLSGPLAAADLRPSEH